MVNTYDRTYFLPLKPRITFKSLDGSDEYFVFNGHDTAPQDVTVIYADAEHGIQETGTANIIVEDSANIINKDHLRNTKVFLELGKKEEWLKHFLIGDAKIFSVSRPRTNYQDYRITVFGSQYKLATLLLNTRRSANVTNLDDPTAKLSPKYNQNKLIEDSFESRKWRPNNDTSIEDITGMTVDVSSNIHTNFPVINLHMESYWNWLDQVCSPNNAQWFVDYSTGAEVLKVRFKSGLHSGIVIKSGDLRTTADEAGKTSFIKDVFSVEDNATNEVNTATRLYTTTIIDRELIASQTTINGSTNTTFKAIAQQVIIQNDQRRITSLGLVLSKKGEPTSPKDRINGDIVMDGGDNKPTGKTLAKFKISLSDIKEQPETIFIDDLDVKVRFLEGENKIWIRLFQRSNEEDEEGEPDGNGDPNHGTDHTVKWHHNGVFATTQTLYSAQAPEGDYDDRDNLDWSSTNKGPIYTFSIFSNIRRLYSRTNATAVNQIGLSEQFIDSSFLKDPKLISEYLSVHLSETSKAKRTIPDFRVTLPNNHLFRPYDVVTFEDGLSNISQDLQIQRVRYIMSGLPGDSQVGALGAEISLSGLYNSLTQSCSCDV